MEKFSGWGAGGVTWGLRRSGDGRVWFKPQSSHRLVGKASARQCKGRSLQWWSRNTERRTHFHLFSILAKLAFLSGLGFSPGAQMVKILPAMWETGVWCWVGEIPFSREGMETHSSILAWRIPWTEEPGRLQSTGWQTVGHDWVTNIFTSWFNARFSQVRIRRVKRRSSGNVFSRRAEGFRVRSREG